MNQKLQSDRTSMITNTALPIMNYKSYIKKYDLKTQHEYTVRIKLFDEFLKSRNIYNVDDSVVVEF